MTLKVFNAEKEHHHFLTTLLKILKSDSNFVRKILFICFNEGPLKTMENAFYFILKALFVLEIFKFLSWVFGHVEKMAWLETCG